MHIAASNLAFSITRRVIPVGMVLATMAASVLVVLQSSPVPALFAGTHDEPKLSTDYPTCAVTGQLNDSTAFESDLVEYMPRRSSAQHVKMNRDLVTAYDLTGRCPFPGPCMKNPARYAEWLRASFAQSGQAPSGYSY